MWYHYNLFTLSIFLYAKSNSRISNGYKLVYRRSLEKNNGGQTKPYSQILKINADRLVYCQYYVKLFDCLSFF